MIKISRIPLISQLTVAKTLKTHTKLHVITSLGSEETMQPPYTNIKDKHIKVKGVCIASLLTKLILAGKKPLEYVWKAQLAAKMSNVVCRIFFLKT